MVGLSNSHRTRFRTSQALPSPSFLQGLPGVQRDLARLPESVPGLLGRSRDWFGCLLILYDFKAKPASYRKPGGSHWVTGEQRSEQPWLVPRPGSPNPGKLWGMRLAGLRKGRMGSLDFSPCGCRWVTNMARNLSTFILRDELYINHNEIPWLNIIH
jgi:hypothetical protein